MDAANITFELDDHEIPRFSEGQAPPNPISPTSELRAPFSSRENSQFKLDATWPLGDMNALLNLDIPPWTEADDSVWPALSGDISHCDYEPQDFDFIVENEISDRVLSHTETFAGDIVSTECTTPPLSPLLQSERPQLQPSFPAGLETPITTSEPEILAATDKRPKRTYISPAAKIIFEEELHANPYPNFGRISLLAFQTSLPFSTVKNWFANNRHRKPVITDEPTVPLCASNLEELARISPAPSNASLDRFLAAEDPVSLPVVSAVTNCSSSFLPISAPWCPFVTPTAPIGTPGYQRANSNYGSDGSADSMGSAASFKSVDRRGSRKGRKGWMEPEHRDHRRNPHIGPSISALTMYNRTSLRNIEARKRRERRILALHKYASLEQDHAPVSSELHLQGWSAYIASQPAPDPPLEISLTPLGPADCDGFYGAHEVDCSWQYICTWPGCTKRFQNRSGWERHEEAVHYNPTHWTCCSSLNANVVIEDCLMCPAKKVKLSHLIEKHFSACAQRNLEDRTFFRKDQLKQHVRRHVSLATNWPPIPEALLQAWRSDNPMLTESALHCGFCGRTFETWKKRTDHVADHLSRGMDKSRWLPQQLL